MREGCLLAAARPVERKTPRSARNRTEDGRQPSGGATAARGRANSRGPVLPVSSARPPCEHGRGGVSMADEDDLAEATRRVWDQNAAFWDERMGEGNDFHLELVRPAVERLLAVRAGERLLDVGCGNGLFARRLADLGAQVVACDVSSEMIERARARGDSGGRVSYRVADATREGDLVAPGEPAFDAAVANMVLMDMPEIAPLAGALARVLRPGGRFVFAVPHPCFHTTGTSVVMEHLERHGAIVTELAVKVSRYRHLGPAKGVAIIGQPVLQYYFDRPLAALLAPFLAAGFALDGLEEPTFAERSPAGATPSLWDAYREVPPVLAARLRAPLATAGVDGRSG
jgi:SAM-dependent methyltransferase